MNRPIRRCVFFDRDGIVNRAPPPPGYVACWDAFELLPEFVDVLRIVRQMGYEAVIATNQRGVALGVTTREAVEEIHANLRRVLAEKHGLDLLDILYCPHEEGTCACRKPAPGMLLEAARRHKIDLASSWMIGDSERDVGAGRAAGCRTILVSEEETDPAPDVRVGSMRELRDRLARILSHASPPPVTGIAGPQEQEAS